MAFVTAVWAEPLGNDLFVERPGRVEVQKADSSTGIVEALEVRQGQQRFLSPLRQDVLHGAGWRLIVGGVWYDVEGAVQENRGARWMTVYATPTDPGVLTTLLDAGGVDLSVGDIELVI